MSRLFSLQYSLVGLFALVSIYALSVSAAAQTTKPSETGKKSSSSSSSSSKNKNVKQGVISALDEESITLRAGNGTTTPYVLTETTRYRKNRLESEASAFKTGDAVFIKLRKVRGKDEYVVQEVNDAVSWDWISDLRKKTTQATITQIGETLDVTIGAEKVPASYTYSDKTKWSKGGKDATPEDFKPGEVVTIVPRNLPSGNVMATIVADNAAGAALTKERYARSVSGTVQTIDAPTKKLTLLTPLKDTRIFAFDEKTEVRIGTKKVPFPTLRVGHKVTANLRKEEDTEETATRITIESKSASAGRKSTASSGASEKADVLTKPVKPKKP